MAETRIPEKELKQLEAMMWTFFSVLQTHGGQSHSRPSRSCSFFDSVFAIPGGGSWAKAKRTQDIVDPLNGEVFLKAFCLKLESLTTMMSFKELMLGVRRLFTQLHTALGSFRLCLAPCRLCALSRTIRKPMQARGAQHGHG